MTLGPTYCSGIEPGTRRPCVRPPNHEGPHRRCVDGAEFALTGAHLCTGPDGPCLLDVSHAGPCTDDEVKTPDHDEVKTPEHYRFPGGVEVKHLTQHLTFFAGNAVKYAARAGRKAGVDELVDLRKARECIDNEIERIEAQRAAI